MVPTRKTRTAYNNVERFHNIPKEPYRRLYERFTVHQLTPERGTLKTELVGAGFN
jgi:hypothetical protein